MGLTGSLKRNQHYFSSKHWADILYSLNAIHMTTCAFDADKSRLASKTVIEILSISCLVLFLNVKLQKKQNKKKNTHTHNQNSSMQETF